ncbi:glycosyltransferase family 4 protein [Rhizobium rhizoryzae]|uniref:glycosyltransferase family 4 protein n=1 Tax=Rhizobium rhizoryzae TaxID=451876 RepID=UPI0028A0919E|nr:glycosyltransferase family 4 protein [Rhizobium rhizoryzae]
MKIAFYAPLKSPYHPVPSGDRLMARQLIRALTIAGHEVDVVSELRSYSATPDTAEQFAMDAGSEIERIDTLWADQGKPDLWFCYHPYYKSPDLLGLELCRAHTIPYVTAESSYSPRRNIGNWALSQQRVLDGLKFAAVNICLTERDRRGILDAAPKARCERLAPFIDVTPFRDLTPQPEQRQLITVAMMREGDKLGSYRALAAALLLLKDEDWRLSIIGDGPARAEVEGCFSDFSSARISFLGQLQPQQIADHLARASIYVWPGHGEAYGLAYLEAQAAGVPVIAEETAGVPEVVSHGETGLLTKSSDPEDYANAIRLLLRDDDLRSKLAENARQRAERVHSLEAAAGRLASILRSNLR